MADSQKKSAQLFSATDYTDITIQPNGNADNLTTNVNTISFDSAVTSRNSGFYSNNFINYIDNYDSTQNYYISAKINSNINCDMRWVVGTNIISLVAGNNYVSYYGTLSNFVCYIIESTAHIVISKIMVSESQHDYEPYNSTGWLHSLRKLATATEAVENPLYSDGTAITAYTIKGNTAQNGTPTPTNPIAVNGVGELDSGDYKIPISSGGVTTNIYLGSTQTVRQIKKLVLTGEEAWRKSSAFSGGFFINSFLEASPNRTAICSHFRVVESEPEYVEGTLLRGGTDNRNLNIRTNHTEWDATDFSNWLATQYSAGTPVTIWYVLATPETATVNEPLMKIDTYADTLSNATAIPTTEGANSITVDTTVQPSEFTATWTGWHDASVKEWDGSQWNE